MGIRSCMQRKKKILMELKIKSIYTQADLGALQNICLQSQKAYRRTNNIRQIVTIAVDMLLWLLAVISVVTAVKEKEWAFAGVAGVMVILGAVFLRRGSPKALETAVWKRYPHKEKKISMTFGETDFTTHVEKTSVTMDSVVEYSSILRLCEDEERFFLFTTAQSAVIVPKRDFQNKDSIDTFRADMKQLTGLPLEHY